MAHHARKTGGEIDLFAKIRDKMGNAAKAEGQSQALNLVSPVVDVYRPPTAKRPAPSKMKGVGKDRKRLRALAKTGGVGSSGSSNPEPHCSYGTELYFTSLAYYLGAERSGASSGFRGLWSQRRCACKRHSDAKVSAE